MKIGRTFNGLFRRSKRIEIFSGYDNCKRGIALCIYFMTVPVDPDAEAFFLDDGLRQTEVEIRECLHSNGSCAWF